MSDRPAGCETPLYAVERDPKDTDAWQPFIEVTSALRAEWTHSEF